MGVAGTVIGLVVLCTVILGLVTLLIDSLLDLPSGVVLNVGGVCFLVLLSMPLVIGLALFLEGLLQ